MTWFTLTIISIFTVSTYYFLSKKILNKPDIDSRFYGAMLQFATGLVSLPIAIIAGYKFELTKESILMLLLVSITYTIGPSLYYMGLKKVDLSKTTILDSTTVLWTVIFGILLLSEEISLLKIIGIILILISIIIVSIDKSFRLKFNKYEVLILIAPIFYGLAAILDKKLLDFSNPTTYVSLSFMCAGTSMLISNLHRIKSVGTQNIFRKDLILICLINGVFLSATYTLIYLAYTRGGEISKIHPLLQTESVIIPLLAIIFLKERTAIFKKLLAAIIAMVGVIVIK